MDDHSVDILKLKESMLSEDTYSDLSLLFKMFADPTRLRIFSALSNSTMKVEDLTEVLDMTQSAISHQLASLRKMNLVRTEKVGRNVFYSLSDDHVMQIFKQALEHVEE